MQLEPPFAAVQQPWAQVFFAQHVSPTAPHAAHMLLTQIAFAPHAWLSQHGWPTIPHMAQNPLMHAAPFTWQAPLQHA
ncbi:hypothetical protein NL529_34285, partial [Klebsiella pneumoniae]|nr:hypothetical protein [Klebsiella pneumoniae]